MNLILSILLALTFIGSDRCATVETKALNDQVELGSHVSIAALVSNCSETSTRYTFEITVTDPNGAVDQVGEGGAQVGSGRSIALSSVYFPLQEGAYLVTTTVRSGKKVIAESSAEFEVN